MFFDLYVTGEFERTTRSIKNFCSSLFPDCVSKYTMNWIQQLKMQIAFSRDKFDCYVFQGGGELWLTCSWRVSCLMAVQAQKRCCQSVRGPHADSGGGAFGFKQGKAPAPNRCCAHKRGTKEARKYILKKKGCWGEVNHKACYQLLVASSCRHSWKNHRISKEIPPPILIGAHPSIEKGGVEWISPSIKYREKKGGGKHHPEIGVEGDWRIASIKSRLQTNSSCLMLPGQIFISPLFFVLLFTTHNHNYILHI